MINGSLVRRAARALSSTRPATFTPTVIRPAAFALSRSFHASSSFLKEHDPDAHEGEKGEHVGSFSRTDNTIQVSYPEEADFPQSKPVQGRGGFHFKRTLASFSLEGGVGLVTGGARGLGLVMSQALVVSGADVAIVDLNSEWPSHCCLSSPTDPTDACRTAQRTRRRGRHTTLCNPSRKKIREPRTTSKPSSY